MPIKFEIALRVYDWKSTLYIGNSLSFYILYAKHSFVIILYMYTTKNSRSQPRRLDVYRVLCDDTYRYSHVYVFLNIITLSVKAYPHTHIILYLHVWANNWELQVCKCIARCSGCHLIDARALSFFIFQFHLCIFKSTVRYIKIEKFWRIKEGKTKWNFYNIKGGRLIDHRITES